MRRPTLSKTRPKTFWNLQSQTLLGVGGLLGYTYISKTHSLQDWWPFERWTFSITHGSTALLTRILTVWLHLH